MLRLTRACSLFFFLAACGGAGGDGGDDDADDATPAPDGGGDDPVDAAPACALPDREIVAAGDSIPSNMVETLQLTSSGTYAVLAHDPAVLGRVALVWDGDTWTRNPITGQTNGQFGAPTFTEIGGRPALLANLSDQTVDSDKLRLWLQLESGAFATGQRVETSDESTQATHARFSTATGVLAVSADNQENTVYSYERAASGTWTRQVVASGLAFPTSSTGVGKLADGTAVIGVASPAGFHLYRRTGVSWSVSASLASASLYDATIEFPPEGSGGARAVALHVEFAAGDHLRGQFIDLATGAPTGSAELLAELDLEARWSQIVFDDTGDAGKILIADGNWNNPRAWIVSFSGTSFEAAQELRPDLVFDGYPKLAFDPCLGDHVIMHASRAPTDPQGPVVLEPLADFAPGI